MERTAIRDSQDYALPHSLGSLSALLRALDPHVGPHKPPEGLTTSTTSQRFAFRTKMSFSDHPQPWPQLTTTVSPFKSACAISQESKLITDFRNQRSRKLSICYSIFKGYKGQMPPPSVAAVCGLCSWRLNEDLHGVLLSQRQDCSPHTIRGAVLSLLKLGVTPQRSFGRCGS